MDFKVILINPPLVYQDKDLYGSIPFMPTGLLYLAGYLKSKGVDVSIIDGFGLAPRRLFRIDEKLVGNGLNEEEIVERVTAANIIGVSVHSGMSHSLALRLAQKIKQKHPSAVLVAGGSHASSVYEALLEGGFDYVCIGEGEHSFLSLIKYIRDKEGNLSEIPGLAYRGGQVRECVFENDLDNFAFAALPMIPLDNYWRLGMQHAPVRGKFMVITTSRGCVYNCRFCTTPKLLGRKWRTRSAKNIVDEIQSAVETYGIEDVIIQDELFGFEKDSALAFAREIQNRKLKIRFSLPSGIKVERMDEEVLSLLRQAGLQYMVFAPESGSARILKKMNKPMDFEKLFRLVSFASGIGIKLGCFFVIGFEDETDEDRRMTKDLVGKLTKLGMDEISIFIWTPLPGAAAFESEAGWSRYEDLNWSPVWKSNYKMLCRFRSQLYRRWLFVKTLHYPVKTLRLFLNALTGRFELKSEMAINRMLHSFFGR